MAIWSSMKLSRIVVSTATSATLLVYVEVMCPYDIFIITEVDYFETGMVFF